jgi:DNA polymerase (family 10)
MSNKEISRALRMLAGLMELHDENPFKIKSVANAAFKVDKLPYPIASKTLDEIEHIDGLGKSIAGKILEIIESNSLLDLSELPNKTPPGIVEMMRIKGLGPKKILVIWKELGIENVGELYYACNENRLIEAKGFGLKTQEEIKKTIEFNMASNGRFLYAQVESFAEALLDQIKNGQPLTVTNLDMTRFIMQMSEAIDLVLFAFKSGNNGEIC